MTTVPKPSIVATLLQQYKRQWNLQQYMTMLQQYNNNGIIYRDLIFSKKNSEFFSEIFSEIFTEIFSEIT